MKKYLCNCFLTDRSNKRSRVQSYVDKPNIIIHSPLYKHIVNNNGKIAKGAKVMYSSGKIEIFKTDKIIYVPDLNELETNPNFGNILDDFNYIVNFLQFKQCLAENKECFIFSEMYSKEKFLKNIYLVKDPGWWGKQYM